MGPVALLKFLTVVAFAGLLVIPGRGGKTGASALAAVLTKMIDTFRQLVGLGVGR